MSANDSHEPTQRPVDPEAFPNRLQGNEGMNVIQLGAEYLFYVDEHLIYRANETELAELFVTIRTYLSLRRHPVINRPFPARREEDPQ